MSNKTCLLTELDALFAEIDEHQINLETLQTNQSAGSFLDEIAKWQTTLQNIEAVLKQWQLVQRRWLQIDHLQHSVQFDEPTSSTFVKADRDFRSLMMGVSSNNNVLKSCQKKSRQSTSERGPMATVSSP
jgi:dynactin complex subunit